MTESSEKPHCALCGAELSGRGTASPIDGKRFCTNKRACINAKGALRRQQRLGPLDLETRPCSWCKVSLPHRPRRSTDSMLGRWCDKPICKNQGRDALFMHDRAVDDFASAEIVECPKCGLSDARVGWVHFTPSGIDFCTGPDAAWTRAPDIVIYFEAWPAQFDAGRKAHLRG